MLKDIAALDLFDGFIGSALAMPISKIIDTHGRVRLIRWYASVQKSLLLAGEILLSNFAKSTIF